MSNVIKFRRRKKGVLVLLPLISCAILLFATMPWSEDRVTVRQETSRPRIINGGDAWQGIRKTQKTTAALSGAQIRGTVSRVRDGDTIVVGQVPVRIANLDCAERGTKDGDRATRQITKLASGAQLQCTLEGRRSYDREVGVCSLADGRDIGTILIAGGYCKRWRG